LVFTVTPSALAPKSVMRVSRLAFALATSEDPQKGDAAINDINLRRGKVLTILLWCGGR
jgi:hypothetical protein